ncbi:MAG: alpha/beta hydrolase-fold protein [Saprospiraceae bacterium]|nr:alpha/beta hydrolase-fold protein [Saprospiraceae bacterium]
MRNTVSPDLSTYLPHIELIADEFEVPQLGKTRRIWALLPHDYYTSRKRYPVLYLQDAQNLFDESAPFGNWAIDRRLAELAAHSASHKLIVVAIDHGGSERIKEYSPYYHRKFGQGEGKEYARFLIDTLKPYVDRTYRTRPERKDTGIGGSSMGALISAYTGLVHPENFGKLMIFSPSFWYSDRIYFDAFNYQYVLPMKIYLYAGEKESRYMTQHIRRFRDAVNARSFDNALTKFNIVINPDGEHNESFWGNAFNDAVEWLYFD